MKTYISLEFELIFFETEAIMITISSASSTTASVEPSSTPGVSTIPKESNPPDNSGWGPVF